MCHDYLLAACVPANDWLVIELRPDRDWLVTGSVMYHDRVSLYSVHVQSWCRSWCQVL